MSHIIADRVLETSTTTGTGAFTLSGAVAGFRAFSAVCATSDTVPYYIEAVDGSGVPTGEWETGVGTYSGTNTLTRTTVLASSNAGSAVAFGSGAKRVGLGLLAAQAVVKDATGKITDKNGGLLTGAYWCHLTADYTLTSTTSAQKAFNTTTNGALTLETGVYEFDALLYLTTMSATSGNYAFNMLGAGTAVTDRWLHQSIGIDNTSPLTTTAYSGSGSVTSTSNASAVTAGTGTGALARHTGMFRVTTAGTVIPSVALVTAAAAVMKSGSFIKVRKIGDSGDTNIGGWS